jgi:hypothetical protein
VASNALAARSAYPVNASVRLTSPIAPVSAWTSKPISTIVEPATINAHPANSAPIASVSSIAPLGKPLALALASTLPMTSIIAAPVVINAPAVRSALPANAFAPLASPIAPVSASIPKPISTIAVLVLTNAYLGKLAPIANAYIVAHPVKLLVLELVSISPMMPIIADNVVSNVPKVNYALPVNAYVPLVLPIA